MTEAALSEAKDRPKGPLKVTAPVAFGSMWLTPRMRDFVDRYPDIQVSLLLDETELDLGMREADVAIRMAPPRQPDLVQRHRSPSRSTSTPRSSTCRSMGRRPAPPTWRSTGWWSSASTAMRRRRRSTG